MLKSLPVWAISIGSFTFFWSHIIMTLYTPLFINSTLHVSIKEVSILFVLFLTSWKTLHIFLSLMTLVSALANSSHCLATAPHLEINCFCSLYEHCPKQKALMQAQVSGTPAAAYMHLCFHTFPISHLLCDSLCILLKAQHHHSLQRLGASYESHLARPCHSAKLLPILSKVKQWVWAMKPRLKSCFGRTGIPIAHLAWRITDTGKLLLFETIITRQDKTPLEMESVWAYHLPCSVMNFQ